MDLETLESVAGLPKGFLTEHPDPKRMLAMELKILERCWLCHELWNMGWGHGALPKDWALAKIIDPVRTKEMLEVYVLDSLVTEWVAEAEKSATL